MRTLLIKDLRLLAPLVLCAVVATFVLHGMVDSAVLLNPKNQGRSVTADFAAQTWVDTCSVNFVFLVPMFAAVGSMAFAHERRERWADFVAMLPVSRERAVAAKLIVSAVVLASMFAFLLIALFGGAALMQVWFGGTTDSLRAGINPALLWGVLPVMVCTAVAAFALAWLLSAILGGPVWPVVVSLAVVLVCDLILAQFQRDITGLGLEAVVEILALFACAGIVAAGSTIQTMRGTP
ncbi:MAG: hypothetical protein JWM57_3205 [Phycisphaerales bacterium]|nr:hypothetical protein [Phycisphaerales bacterium]